MKPFIHLKPNNIMKNVLLITIAIFTSVYFVYIQSVYAVQITPERLGNQNVPEDSGIVASLQYPGVYWHLGDSGTGPYIYAVWENGTRIRRFSVSGASNTDWEDIAIDCNTNELWIGEIGDNPPCTRTNLKVYKIPETERYSKGKAIVNIVGLEPDEKISAVIPIREFKNDEYLVFATKKGIVKKTALKAYSRPRQGGIWAINLQNDDDVIGVIKTTGDMKIIIATKEGMAVRFNETDVRPVSRHSQGVKGITLKKDDDEVIGMVIAEPEKTLLTVTENGYGKRTIIANYRLINRGGSGVINIKTSERNGKVATIKSVTDEDELMFISVNGQVIRTSSKFISVIGRNTQGVTLMRLNKGDKVADAAKIVG